MEKGKIMKTRIKKTGINGEGIGYKGKKPIFIMHTFPGELVEFTMDSENEKYGTGTVEKVLEASPRRHHSVCRYWKECGGCSLIQLDYKGQVRTKEALLKEALRKYAGYTGPIMPLVKNPSVLGYRNACKLPLEMVDGKIETGMYERNSNKFVPLPRCLIHSKILEATRGAVVALLNQFHVQACSKSVPSGFRTLVMKEFGGKVQIIFVTGKTTIAQELIEQLMKIEEVVSIWQSVKKDNIDHELFGSKMIHLAGQEKMEVEVDGLKLQLLPRSFFQLNTQQAARLYKIVEEWTPISNVVVEAYSGIGAMTLLVSSKAKKVIGIESIEDAVINAKENAVLNHKENVEFICGDAGSELNKIAQENKIDTLIVDPPRTGLNAEMIEAIKTAKIQTIIYISCNPSTLGKNLESLKEYKIAKVQPVDIFSQTAHVETVCLLTKVHN